MSGYPHGLSTPPHGDALLPNRTGGGMTTKDALAILLLNTWEQGVDDQARSLAPVIEKGLRAAAMEMNAVHGWADYDVTPTEVDGCVTAGVAAMVEEL